MNGPESNESRRFAGEANQPQMGLLAELFAFMRENKKWWLAPIILALLAIGVLVVLSGTAAAPFIYPLF